MLLIPFADCRIFSFSSLTLGQASVSLSLCHKQVNRLLAKAIVGASPGQRRHVLPHFTPCPVFWQTVYICVILTQSVIIHNLGVLAKHYT